MTKKFVFNFSLSALCYIALGIALIVWPAASINVFCYVLGGVTAAYGLWQIYRFISHREERYATLTLLVGIVALALGICFFVKPELFASILPFILGLYLIFDGVVKLQAALDIKKEGYPKWGILLLLAALFREYEKHGKLAISVKYLSMNYYRVIAVTARQSKIM